MHILNSRDSMCWKTKDLLSVEIKILREVLKRVSEFENIREVFLEAQELLCKVREERKRIARP